MGIQGLIPFLEKSSRPVNVSEYSGGTVAVDAYCWLHKGTFSCADKLARGEQCLSYVHYCMKFVNMLLSYNIKPILVFDGQHLHAKSDTEKKRRAAREQNRKKGAELLRLDRGKEALTYLRRSVDVTHEMALNLIRECRARNVDCIVAPYEADAQLAYLNINGIADLIITEDSDLLLFGAKRVLFKMDMSGLGLLIEQEKLYIAMGVKEESFSFEKFRQMCILSGCDYLPSLPGIGLVKANRFIKRISDPDIHRAISRIGSYLNMSQLSVPIEYRDNFLDAEATFKYQLVFDPFEMKLVPLTPYPEDKTKVPNYLLNCSLTSEQAIQLAYGNLDPLTLRVMDDWNPNDKVVPINRHSNVKKSTHPSIWEKDYKALRQSSQKKIEPPCALTRTSASGIRIVVHNTSISGKVQSLKRWQEQSPEKCLEKLIDAYRSPIKQQQVKKKLKLHSDSEWLTEEEEDTHRNVEQAHKSYRHCTSLLEDRTLFTEDEEEDISVFKKRSSLPPFRPHSSESQKASSRKEKKQTSLNCSVVSKLCSYSMIVVACIVICWTINFRYFVSSSNCASSTRLLEQIDNKEEAENIEAKLAKIENSILEDDSNDSFVQHSERHALSESSLNAAVSVKSPGKANIPSILGSKHLSSGEKKRNPFALEDGEKKNRHETAFAWPSGSNTDYAAVSPSAVAVSNRVLQNFRSPVENCELSGNSDIVSSDLDKTEDNNSEEIVDEGFYSLSPANTPSPKEQKKSPVKLQKKACRTPGLTKKAIPSSSLKQQSLLSMFGFKKPKSLKL